MKMLALATAGTALAFAPAALPPALYEVTTETSMPHLEENLRYATTTEKRCLTNPEPLSAAFPVLQHVSLKNCRLEQETRDSSTVSYVLVCDGGHGTTGTATWELGERRMTGTLQVKLGGKNMTFSQRVTAITLRKCGTGR
jgi:hypothetical protein